VGRLLAALGEVRAFLRNASMAAWDEYLQSLELRIADAAARTGALQELEQSFGGMGSLNDVFICAENGHVPPGQSPEAANEEIDRLLDAVFRELKLVEASAATRLVWRWYERRHRGEPVPRIKNAFAARGQGE
jgi:uncharacterized protein DUF6966